MLIGCDESWCRWSEPLLVAPTFIESRGWWLHRSAVDQGDSQEVAHLRGLECGLYPRGYSAPTQRDPWLRSMGGQTLDVAFRRSSHQQGLQRLALPSTASLVWCDGKCRVRDVILQCTDGPLTVPARWLPLLQLGDIMDAGSGDFVGVFDRATKRPIAIVATAEMREPAWLRARQEVAA